MAQQSSKSQSEELQSVQRNNFGPNSTIHQRNNFAVKKQKKSTNKRKRENQRAANNQSIEQSAKKRKVSVVDDKDEKTESQSEPVVFAPLINRESYHGGANADLFNLLSEMGLDSYLSALVGEGFESVDDLRNITDDVLYHLGMKTGYRYRILAWQGRDYLQREAKQNKEHNGTNEEEQSTNEPPKGGKADEWRHLEALRVVDIKVLCQTRGNTKDLNVKKEQLVRLVRSSMVRDLNNYESLTCAELIVELKVRNLCSKMEKKTVLLSRIKCFYEQM
eukprot:88301_1